ncbi:hypothetical protein [Aporhodopirellula aestuarii]|uniref:Uncharacterized protein n=1 Tax=Aporhodopirellula aestuarii TaxID=2950107 RepID=A0ABT0UC51_9BACT|nr:hypothetical protein [Aporhodopirellula aestuarii]MCM2373916.1 hypothetical protein [Aporhodopirellula aestuarii]
MAKEIVVSLTSDEERLLRGFRRVEAAEKSVQSNFEQTGKVAENVGKRIADAMIKAGRDGTGSLNKHLAALRRDGGRDGRQLAEGLEKNFRELGLHGRRSIEEISDAIARLDPEAGKMLAGMRQELEATKRTDLFSEKRQELAALGGDFAIMAQQIDSKINAPLKDTATAAEQLVKEMQELSPENAEAISKALSEAQQVIEKTRLDDLVKELEQGDKSSREMAKTIRGQLPAAFDETQQSVESVLQAIKEMRPELTGTIDEFQAKLAAANKETSFAKIRDELASLGGEYKVLAAEIDKATAPNLEQRVAEGKRLVAELRKIDPDKAEALDRALANARKSVADTKLDKLMSQLSQASADGQSLAKALGTGMQEASLQAEGGIDAIADRIIALRPEMKATVDQWRAGMAEAARFGEGEYARPLATLREAGPIGRRVADELRRQLVESGQIIERTFEDMLAPLQRIDPIAAEQARAMHAHFDDIENRGRGAFHGIAQSAIAQGTAIISSYVGVQEAIQTVTKMIQDQRQMMKDASDAHMGMAEAQQEAIKNLSTLPEKQRDELINVAAYDIASKAGIPEIPQIVRAIGNARSAGGDFEEVKSAVEVAAMTNPLTPDKIAPTASSLIDMANATGIADARINANQAFVAGAEARMEDPIKVAKAMAPVAVAAANRAPEGMRDIAAYQGMALMSAISKLAADKEGDTSSTGTIQIMDKLNEFVSDLQEELTTTQKEITTEKYKSPLSAQQSLQKRDLESRQSNKATTDQWVAELEKVLAEMDAEDARLDPRSMTKAETTKRRQQRASLKSELSKARSMQFEDADAAKLEDLQAKEDAAKKKFAEEQEKRKKRVQELQDAGVKAGEQMLPFDQFALLHRAPGLKKEFAALKFGEQRVRPSMDQLIDNGEAFDIARNTFSKLDANRGRVDLYESKLHDIRNLTPQIRETILRRQGEANTARANITNTSGASLSNVRENAVSTLERTRDANWFFGTMQYVGEAFTGSGGLAGDNALEESVSSISRFAARIEDLKKGGITGNEEAQIGELRGAIEVARGRLASPELLNESPDQLRELRNRAAYEHNLSESISTESESTKILAELVQVLQMQMKLQEKQLEEAEKARKAAEEQRDEQRRRDSQPNRSRPPSPSDAQREAARRSAERAGGVR